MNIVKAKNPVKAWEYLVEGFLLKNPNGLEKELVII